MNSMSTNEEWLRRMAALEDNCVVSVGGLACHLTAMERNERSVELMAIGKFIEVSRREKGLTSQELCGQAHVTEEALWALERGLRLPNTRDVLCLVAKALDLPAEKLLAAAGMNGAGDPRLSAAAVRFAVQASPPEKLSPAEESALGQFREVLAVA